MSPRTLISSSGSSFEFSQSGSLIYVPGAPSQGYRLVWASRDGTEEPLPFNFPTALLRPGGNASIEMALSAASVAITMVADGQDDIWNYNVADHTLELVTTHPADDRSPLWTLDEQELVFSSNRAGGEWGLFLKRANGTGDATPFLRRDGVSGIRARSWSPDGTLVFEERTAATGLDILILPVDGESTPLIQTLDNEQQPAVSPNGRWIAYVSDRSGQREVYVDRFPNTGQRERVSTDGGRNPRWSTDGRELTFWPEWARQVAAVSFDPETGDRSPEYPVLEGTYVGDNYGLDPAGGGHLLVVKEAGALGRADGRVDMILVQNWFDELQRLVPSP